MIRKLNYEDGVDMSRRKKDYKRIVVKVGSSTITHENGTINLSKIYDLAWQLSNLRNYGVDVVLVSSGAVAAGAKRLNLCERPKSVRVKQAASAVGQVALMNTYNMAFNEFNYQTAQILLTRLIETDDEMYKNAKNSFDELFSLNVIPIVNENDTISTYEIKFGDNDTLSAVVSRIVEADLLILLSDIDGLYDDDPKKNKDAKLIKEVTKIDGKLEDMAHDTNSNVGTGGMATKIKACKLCLEKDIDVIIANGSDMINLRRIANGEEIGTLFTKGEN